MLTTQARVAMHNRQPVKLVGDLYHIIDIKRMNGTSRMIATIKKIGLAEGKYEPIDVGTYKEVSANQHMSVRYLRSIKSKTPERLAYYENKHYRNGMLIISL